MASILSSATQRIGGYFTPTVNQCLSPQEQDTSNSSTISWASSSPTAADDDLDLDFVNEVFSHTSNITTPATSISSDFDYPTVSLLKPKQSGKVEDSIRGEDFGTFEDWLHWDDTEPQGSTSMNNNSSLQTQQDDSVVFVEDPVSNSPLFQPRDFNLQPNIDTRIDNTSSSFDNLNLVGIPPQATIFNSPPQLAGAPVWPQPQQQYIPPAFFTSILSPQEEARLRRIAMPQLATGPVFSAPDYNSTSRSPSDHGHVSKRPAVDSSHSSSQRATRRKRKPSVDGIVKRETGDMDDDYPFTVEDPATSSSSAPGTGVAPKGKKTSHNMIEKRYRNNLNDKIAELRDSVPSLRVMSKHGNPAPTEDEEEGEDLDGLTPAHRLNKATILSKATEYINHLERRNDHLTKENAGLKARVDAFEILMMSRQQSQPQPPPQPSQYSYQAQTQQAQQHHQPQQQQQLNYAQRGNQGGWMS